MGSDQPPINNPPTWTRLLNLRELEQISDEVWQPEEMAAVFQHQLSTAVQFDLHDFAGAGAAGQLRTLCATEGLLVRSFKDLLQHPSPPLELLEMTKQFAKASCYHAEAVIPKDIATVLYYASIVEALVRRGRRITSLGDQDGGCRSSEIGS